MSDLSKQLEKLDVAGESSAPPLSKRILTKAHLEAFQASTTHQEIVDAVEEWNASVIGVKLGQAGETSPVSVPYSHVHGFTLTHHERNYGDRV
jgi:hypothetical protein